MQILDSLGINHTIFYQFAIFVVLYFALSRIFFRPFLRLIQLRQKKTIDDLEEAKKMMEQAQARLDEYQDQIRAAKVSIREEVDSILTDAKNEETRLLNEARAKVKAISGDALREIEDEKQRVASDLDKNVEELARSLSEKLLAGGKS